jgi:hypothetical protein
MIDLIESLGEIRYGRRSSTTRILAHRHTLLFDPPWSFLNPPPLVEDPEKFDRASNISFPLPWWEGKKGRGIRSVGVTPHLASPRHRGEDLLCSCGDAPLEAAS